MLSIVLADVLSMELARSKSYPVPPNEVERLAALHAYRVLDSLPEPSFDRIAEMAARLFQAPIALVSLVDSDRQWFKAKCGLDDSETPRELSFCGHTMLNEEPMVVCDATQDPRFRNNSLVTGELSIRYYIGAPLRTSSGLGLGSLCVIDKVPRERPSQALLDCLSDLAALVVENLEFRTTVAARNAAEKGRREAEERYRLFAETARDLFLIVDAQGIILTANLACQKLLGYAPDELVGQPLEKTIPGYSLEMREGTMDLSATHKSGASIAVEISFSRFNNGEPMFTAILRDVTDRNEAMETLRQTTEALRTNESKLNEAQQIAHLGHWEWHLLNGTLTWSDETYRLFGLVPRSGITFERYQSLLPKEDLPWVRAVVSASIESGEPFSVSHSILRDDGSVINVEGRGRVERDSTGKAVKVVGTILDVTSRVQSDLKLRRSYEELESRVTQRTELLAESNAALEAEVEQHKMTQGIVSGQNEALRMIAEGVPTNEVFKSLLLFSERESKGKVAAAILLKTEDGERLRLAAALNTPGDATFPEIDISGENGASAAAAWSGRRVVVTDVLKDPTFPIIRTFHKYDGARSLAAAPILGNNNQVLGTVSFAIRAEIPTEYELRLQDICANMAAIAIQRERERHNSDEILRAYRFLANSLPQMVFTCGPDGKLACQNEPACAYTGLTLEQAAGQGWLGLLHREDDAAAKVAWDRALRSGQSFRAEFRIRRGRDGAYRWHLGNAFPYRNNAGEIIRWVCICNDIHERKIEDDRVASEARMSNGACLPCGSNDRQETVASLLHVR